MIESIVNLVFGYTLTGRVISEQESTLWQEKQPKLQAAGNEWGNFHAI